jgi:phospholipid N-methyltransferase
MNYIIYYDRDWTWLKFDNDPGEEVRDVLKTRWQFSWSRKKQAWYCYETVEQSRLESVIGEPALGVVSTDHRSPCKTWRGCLAHLGDDSEVHQPPKYEAIAAECRQVERDSKLPKPNQKLAAKFCKMADNLTDKIAHARRPMTQNPTPKRNAELQSRLHEANNMENLQKALYALADLHERGECPALLADLRTKDDIGALVCFSWVNTGGWGYDSHGTREYAEDSEQARALQALISGSPEEAQEQARADELSRLEAAVRLRVGDIPGFFPTPRKIAELMVELAGIESGMNVLEPSAGSGAIADVIHEMHPDAHLGVIECSSTLRHILELKGHNLLEDGDFLRHFVPRDGVSGFDRIVMNPPFENRQDIDHVKHAFDWVLGPGGRIITIMSEGTFFANGKASEFREWLDEEPASWYDMELPDDAFKESGTGVKARIVVIEK